MQTISYSDGETLNTFLDNINSIGKYEIKRRNFHPKKMEEKSVQDKNVCAYAI